jgi:citrate synthase
MVMLKREDLFTKHQKLADSEIEWLLSTASVVIAAVLCHITDRELIVPDPEASFIGNFLKMVGMIEKETGQPDPQHVSILERLWIVSVDHEMNNSTSAFIHAASCLSDPVSCMISAMASGCGARHGGAMEKVLSDLELIGDVENVPTVIEMVKAKKIRLFGYGHKKYKVRNLFQRYAVHYNNIY